MACINILLHLYHHYCAVHNVHTKPAKFGCRSYHMSVVNKYVTVYTSMEKCCDKAQFWHCIPLGISLANCCLGGCQFESLTKPTLRDS